MFGLTIHFLKWLPQLMSAKKRSTWNKSTNRMLTKFIRSAVETGALSAVAAAVDLAFYLCFNQNNIHTILYVQLFFYRAPRQRCLEFSRQQIANR